MSDKKRGGILGAWERLRSGTKRADKEQFYEIRFGEPDEDSECPLCNFQGSPAELVARMRAINGEVPPLSPLPEEAMKPGHWEEVSDGVRRWVSDPPATKQ